MGGSSPKLPAFCGRYSHGERARLKAAQPVEEPAIAATALEGARRGVGPRPVCQTPTPQRAAAPATRTRADGNGGPDTRRPFSGHSDNAGHQMTRQRRCRICHERPPWHGKNCPRHLQTLLSPGDLGRPAGGTPRAPCRIKGHTAVAHAALLPTPHTNHNDRTFCGIAVRWPSPETRSVDRAPAFGETLQRYRRARLHPGGVG